MNEYRVMVPPLFHSKTEASNGNILVAYKTLVCRCNLDKSTSFTESKSWKSRIEQRCYRGDIRIKAARINHRVGDWREIERDCQYLAIPTGENVFSFQRTPKDKLTVNAENSGSQAPSISYKGSVCRCIVLKVALQTTWVVLQIHICIANAERRYRTSENWSWCEENAEQ